MPDSIVLHYWGDSTSSAYTWTLTITALGRAIFDHQQNDKSFDEFFGDEDFEVGCTGYVACKSKYYEKDILGKLVLSEKDYNLDAFTSEAAPNGLFGVGRPFLKKCCGLSGREATRVLESLARSLKSKRLAVISVPGSPAQSGTPMAYSRMVNRFLPVYAE